MSFTLLSKFLTSYALFLFPGIERIWHYKQLDRKLRKEKGLPALEDEEDLPDPLLNPNFTHVLTEKQQKELALREFLSSYVVVISGLTLKILYSRPIEQKRFTKSQTWYRAHATDTHRVSRGHQTCQFVPPSHALSAP